MWRLYKNNLAFLRFHVTLNAFFDSVLVFFVSFAVGARILYIVEHFEFFRMNVLSWLLFLHFPGFSFLGGVIGGALGLWFFCRHQKMPFLLFLDIMAVGLPLALGFSQIGSLLATGNPTHLYEILSAFGTFALLYTLYVRGRMRVGELSLLSLLLLSIAEFFVEFLRGDSVYLGGFAIAQIVSGILAVMALSVLFFLHKARIWFLIQRFVLRKV